MEDGRCKLGLAGRLQLVRLIESGCSFRTAAAESAVSVATAHRWWHRWRGDGGRAGVAGVFAGPPAGPEVVPVGAEREAEQRILDARARTNYGPARLAGLVGYRRSTIWKVLRAPWLLAAAPLSAAADVTAAMSGRSRGRCCTSTPSSCRVRAARALGDRRPRRAARNRGAGTVYVVTASSMTTAAWPTSSCTAPRPP